MYFASICSAVTGDANRAIEMMNASNVGGRKIAVKHAMHRAPLEQRRLKTSQGTNACLLKVHATPLRLALLPFILTFNFPPYLSAVQLDDTLKSKNDNNDDDSNVGKTASKSGQRGCYTHIIHQSCS